MKKSFSVVLRRIANAASTVKRACVSFLLMLKSKLKHSRQTTGAHRSSLGPTPRPVSIRSSHHAVSSAPVNQTSVLTRVTAKFNFTRKNKRVIAGACGLIVVAAVVLAIALPTSKDDAMASAADGIAFKGSLSHAQDEAATPQTTDTQGVGMVSMEQPEVSGSTTEATSTTLPTTESNTQESTAIATTAPDKVELVPGCHDPQMIEIQTRLMELNYLDNDEPTDYYGSGTEFALQLFQRKHSLQVDGILGDQTMTLLFSPEAKPYTVKLEDRGWDVKAIQERLHELNYLKAEATNYFGTDTEAAVKAFQKRNGLDADGNVGEYTKEVLFSEDAKAAKVPAKTNNKSDGGKTHSNGPIAVGDPDQASVDKLIEVAKSKLGCEYTRGAKGPNEFDCSGFVYYCLNTAGYRIKYMTSGGWAKSGLPKVEKMSDMKRGDIICFKGHVGIYMGDGQMIDAGSGTDNVRICSNIFKSSYWTRTFICARRVF